MGIAGQPLGMARHQAAKGGMHSSRLHCWLANQACTDHQASMHWRAMIPDMRAASNVKQVTLTDTGIQRRRTQSVQMQYI